MRPAFNMVATMAALALGSCALLFGSNVQTANAQPQPGSPSRPVPAARQSSDKSYIAQASSQVKLKAASARPKLAPPALEPPLFLSEAYLKKEQQTEDRLKRVMNICSGC